MASNPLATIQREVSGPLTYDKYQYQYHWALCRIIEEHECGNEFVVFVELHEDVVVSDSLDATKATFQFNQIKTNKEVFNVNELTKIKKINGKASKTNSVLAKLILSCVGKPFSPQISEINLVSVNGFNKNLVSNTHNSNIITVNDLLGPIANDIEAKLKAEISGFSKLPIQLKFIRPDFPDKAFQDIVIGKISRAIAGNNPLNNYDSVQIYRTLIDDLNRKGVVFYDFPEWHDLLKNKGVVSIDVKRIFGNFTAPQNGSLVREEFSEVVKEMGLTVMERRDMWQSYQRHFQRCADIKDVKQISVSAEIQGLIASNKLLSNRQVSLLVDLVFNALSTDSKGY
ncbi:MAG: DUF4297 domain-containing protein, partial [Sphingobacteriaceae bacterium]